MLPITTNTCLHSRKAAASRKNCILPPRTGSTARFYSGGIAPRLPEDLVRHILRFVETSLLTPTPSPSNQNSSSCLLSRLVAYIHSVQRSRDRGGKRTARSEFERGPDTDHGGSTSQAPSIVRDRPRSIRPARLDSPFHGVAALLRPQG